VFLALGINIEGQKELLDMWLAENKGTKFWLNVLTELKNRGLNDKVYRLFSVIRTSRGAYSLTEQYCAFAGLFID